MNFFERHQIFTFVADLVQHLAWPLVALIALLSLRPIFNSFFSRIDRFKYGDAEIKLAGAVDSLTDRASELGVTLLYPNIHIKEGVDVRNYIISSWIEIENILKNWAKASSEGENKGYFMVSDEIKRLSSLGLIDPRLKELLLELYNIRNKALHAQSFTMPEGEMRELGGLIMSVKNRLKSRQALG